MFTIIFIKRNSIELKHANLIALSLTCKNVFHNTVIIINVDQGTLL
jgi:hypothetical protein